MSEVQHFLWVEKYRPHTVADTILPSSLKKTFQAFVSQGNIPHLLLSGPPGTGKTTIAKAMIEELGASFYEINGSKEGTIDTLRNEIQDFAASMSHDGQRKYVIIDEADYMNPNSFQPALRKFMEEFSSLTGFILTCNYKSRIIEPLHSRCSVIDFRVSKADFKEVATSVYNRIQTILNAEKVDYDKKVLAEVIKKHFPDTRRVLNELQAYANTHGKIDSGILSRFTEEMLKTLVAAMQQKNFSAVREWVTENSDLDPSDLFRNLYDQLTPLITPASVPPLVMILARYQYQAAFVADPDINLAACFAEIMVEVSWK